ncbi:hypothetical protein EUTSA_v10022959mg [Eutrema salsugineum]|uniref:Uncharacterized protein n=1 Tax=Eutrema salsugineum TaxID=72664 RepID=V4LKU4_EUTSA|nr:hypothetical protein EUTSA_v10022959mg [Eutrema salsugineum]
MQKEESSSIHNESTNDSIPSGANSVWADVSPLLSASCSDEAIESGFAPVPISSDRTVNVESIIDIMDHLLVCEVFSIEDVLK